ncbi:BnaC02g23020D [Brassica napus]|uniref:BnaC02g23020D protein n=1 Tax=Brassica napus TaxID=3708 RepID=A0A078HLC4_BRANA|nr:BnaC02g23020D [Brassica napus]
MNLTDFSMGFGSVFSLSGIHQVELFKHPHVLLLQYRNSIFKLPSGRLRLGESNIEGLKRKLASKLLVNENVLVPGWSTVLIVFGLRMVSL